MQNYALFQRYDIERGSSHAALFNAFLCMVHSTSRNKKSKKASMCRAQAPASITVTSHMGLPNRPRKIGMYDRPLKAVQQEGGFSSNNLIRAEFASVHEYKPL